MPPTLDYLPRREANLLAFTTNFNARIGAAPASFGLSAAQAAAFSALNAAWASAYAIAKAPSTRTSISVAAKDAARNAVVRGVGGVRELAAIVQAHPGITPEQLINLGLTVRDTEPSPIPPPEEAPDIDVVSIVGRRVKIRLHEAGKPMSKARPVGVLGAVVFSCVGEDAPKSLDEWKYQGCTTRTIIDIDFPAAIPAGSTVWLTAQWLNPRMQHGPVCQPIRAEIGGGLAAAA